MPRSKRRIGRLFADCRGIDARISRSSSQRTRPRTSRRSAALDGRNIQAVSREQVNFGDQAYPDLTVRGDDLSEMSSTTRLSVDFFGDKMAPFRGAPAWTIKLSRRASLD
jgi:hypothetical protein